MREHDQWICPYCGESYRFQTHPGCLRKALQERDEAQAALNLVSIQMSDLHSSYMAAEEDLAEASEAAKTCWKQSRDEARGAAKELLALLQDSAADHEHDEQLFNRWSWLKES